MDFRLIGALSFVFVGFTFLGHIMEGAFISAADLAMLHSITGYRTFDLLGLFSIPIPNVSFFTTGLIKLVQWDYNFFGGPAAFIQYFLYSVSAAFMFGLIIILLGIGISILAKMIPWG